MEQHIRGIGKRNTIIKAMDYLLDKQVIAKIGGARNNQNFWLFKPEKINEWLIMTYPSRPFSNGLTDTSRLKKDDLENPSRPFSNGKPFKKGRLVVQKRTTNKKNKEKGILLSEEYEKEKRGGVFFQKEEKNFSTRRVQNSSPPSSAAPPHDPHIVTVEMDRQAAQVLDHLNEITDSNYRNTGRNKKDIVARLKEGYLVDDFKKVIELKAMQWANTKQAQYLRPSTLFGDHFESYLIFAEKAALNPKIVKNTSNVHEPIISKESIISVAESVLAENLYGN